MTHNPNQNPRPIITIPPTSMNKIFDFISVVGLVIMFVVILQSFSALPNRIPVHFNIAGEPDGWGSKYTFWVFPILGLIMYITLTIVSKFPHTYNYVWPITEQNAPQQYLLATQLMNHLKVEIITLFTFLEWQGIRVGLGIASGLGVVFAPAFLFILLGTISLYFWQAYQAR
jgi:hypothetical protein